MLYALLKNSGGGGTGSNITVENVLTSTSTVNALSALQGKTLNDKFLNYILASKLGAVNGVATLDASGKVPLSQISVVNAKIVAVANQTARLALPVSTNLTIAIQSDTNWVWGLNANADPTLTTNWIDMGSADAKVASVNGSTGVVTITADSINAVPNTRKVNNKQLNADITITLGDLLTFNNDSSYYLSGKGILEKLPSSAGTVVEDTLTSTSTTNALSANQGKILNEKLNSPLYYLNAKPTNVTTANADIPLTVTGSNMTYTAPFILLKSGYSYDLMADIGFRGSAYVTYAFVDNNNLQLTDSTTGLTGAVASTDPLAPTKAYASVTPSTDMYVKLRILTASGISSVDINSSRVEVRQRPNNVTVGKIDTANVLVQDWTSYTPYITAVTTNPIFGTGASFKCSYKTIGKSLTINFNLIGNSTGGNYGSGMYKIPIPAGITIDTTKVNLATASNRYQATPIVNFVMTINGGNNPYNCTLYAWSATELVVWTQSGYWSSTVHTIVAEFGFITPEIPIL